MWPVFSLQFNVGFWGNHAAGEIELISVWTYQFLPILNVLGLIWKLWIIAFRGIFYHVNVASIQLAIQFRVFGQACSRRGRTNHFVDLPILAHSWHSWALLKAIINSFPMNSWSCKCGQYLVCNSISGFWAFF